MDTDMEDAPDRFSDSSLSNSDSERMEIDEKHCETFHRSERLSMIESERSTMRLAGIEDDTESPTTNRYLDSKLWKWIINPKFMSLLVVFKDSFNLF